MSTPTAPQWLVICTKPSRTHLPYLKGPCDPWYVRRFGYEFTEQHDKAWTFPSERAAANKARIVNAHIGWTKQGENWMKAVMA